MSASKKVLLINPSEVPVMTGLADALRSEGAQVLEMQLGDYNVLFDALEQGWMPVVLKPPPA
jgi:hypothetical protein